MLITFKSKAHADVVMLGDSARELIRLMGKSDALPSAVGPEGIPKALAKLKAALAEQAGAPADTSDDGDEEKESVALHTRAFPLIEMLEASEQAQVPVMWEAGKRSY
ncbi:MAG: DUF1840 domain-containing protein [Woeseiaceae bacterium]|nr:DUF1840 domain-containing protein [Woeseiaceae bacterium]